MRRQQFNESADKFLQLERTYGNNLHLLEYGARSLVYAGRRGVYLVPYAHRVYTQAFLIRLLLSN